MILKERVVAYSKTLSQHSPWQRGREENHK